MPSVLALSSSLTIMPSPTTIPSFVRLFLMHHTHLCNCSKSVKHTSSPIANLATLYLAELCMNSST